MWRNRGPGGGTVWGAWYLAGGKGRSDGTWRGEEALIHPLWGGVRAVLGDENAPGAGRKGKKPSLGEGREVAAGFLT